MQQRREPFSPHDDCPGYELEDAELPDFCNMDRVIKLLHVRPVIPDTPDMPVYTCPCPKSDSKYVWFSMSDDCCDWDVHFDEPSVVVGICDETFELCDCGKKCYNPATGVFDYCCNKEVCARLAKDKDGAAEIIMGSHEKIRSDGKRFTCPTAIIAYSAAASASSSAQKFELEVSDALCEYSYPEAGRDMIFYNQHLNCEGSVCIKFSNSKEPACMTVNLSELISAYDRNDWKVTTATQLKQLCRSKSVAHLAVNVENPDGTIEFKEMDIGSKLFYGMHLYNNENDLGFNISVLECDSEGEEIISALIDAFVWIDMIKCVTCPEDDMTPEVV